MTAENKRYKIIVKGSDPFGFAFLDRVVDLANKGAKIDRSHNIRMEFPHQCVMILESKEEIETDILKGIEVFPLNFILSREEMMGLKMPDLQRLCREDFGITGTNKEHLARQYLEAATKAQEALEGK